MSGCSISTQLARSALLKSGMQQYLKPGVTSGGHPVGKAPSLGGLAEATGFAKHLEAPMKDASARFNEMRDRVMGQGGPLAGGAQGSFQPPGASELASKVVMVADTHSKDTVNLAADIVAGKSDNIAKLRVLSQKSEESATFTIQFIKGLKDMHTYFAQTSV